MNKLDIYILLIFLILPVNSFGQDNQFNYSSVEKTGITNFLRFVSADKERELYVSLLHVKYFGINEAGMLELVIEPNILITVEDIELKEFTKVINKSVK